MVATLHDLERIRIDVLFDRPVPAEDVRLLLAAHEAALEEVRRELDDTFAWPAREPTTRNVYDGVCGLRGVAEAQTSPADAAD